MHIPPGPRGREVLGFFGAGSVSGTLDFLAKTARQYGPISSFRLLHKRIYVVDDADLIKEILVNQQHKFERDSGAALLRELVGDALITREEPLHRERRRVLQPAFHRDQIACYADIMAAESERLSNQWKTGETIDVRAEMRRLTLAIVGTALFGTDFRNSAEQVARVLQRVAARSRWLAPGIALLEPLVSGYRRMFPNGRSLFFDSERRELERIIDPVIEGRRGSSTRDIVSLLLNVRSEGDQPLEERQIRNEIVTFVLAGHETTATALTWTWWLLAAHPAVALRLRQEVDAVLGDRVATLEDAARLTYTALVFQEAMRLYPPALAFARRAKAPIELAGYIVPRGCSVFVSPYITQRNPKYFHDADRFRPERWETDPPAPKFAYFPFGGGAKMCIGEPFAKLEGVLALAILARRWELEAIGDDPIGIGAGMLLNPDRPIAMKLAARAASSFRLSFSRAETHPVEVE